MNAASRRLIYPTKVGVLILCLVLLTTTYRSFAQKSGETTNGNSDAGDVTYAPVKVEGRVLFELTSLPNLPASQRAERVNRRLENLITRAQDVPPFVPKDLVKHEGESIIALGGDRILSVTDADAEENLSTRDELAAAWEKKLEAAVQEARSARANPLAGITILLRNSISDLFTSMVKWLPRLAGAVILWLLFLCFALIAKKVAHMVTRRMRLDGNLEQLFESVSFYGTWIIGLVAILSTLGIDGGGIATGLGVSGFVLGFAFKDILSHFFAGLMLLVGRQFHIGDQIVVKEFEGTVERIELRALYLRTYDNRLVIIPNGDVFTSTVTSNTASTYRRRDFVVGISYQDDIERAQDIAMQAMQETTGVLAEPEPDVLVDSLAASTVNLRLRFYTSSLRADYMKVGSACLKHVKDSFDKHGISMPTDIRTIIIQNPEDLIPIQAGKQKTHGT